MKKSEQVVFDVFETPLGRLALVSSNGLLKESFFLKSGRENISSLTKALEARYDSFAEYRKLPRLRSAVRSYFAGSERSMKKVAIAPRGTAFQQSVWRELQRIPLGKTLTYAEVARRVKRPGAARAVGGACNKNPVILFVPCHRVVGANGKLVGFAAGISRKAALLRAEASSAGI